MNTLEKLDSWISKATNGEKEYFLLFSREKRYACLQEDYNDRITELKVVIWKENELQLCNKWKVSENMEEAQEPQKLIIVIKNDKKMIVVIDGTTIFSIGLNGQKENTTVLVFFRTEGSANFIFASDEAKKIERWSYWQEKDSAASLCFEKLLSVYKVADKCNVEGV